MTARELQSGFVFVLEWLVCFIGIGAVGIILAMIAFWLGIW